jgi:hypothetical protein
MNVIAKLKERKRTVANPANRGRLQFANSQNSQGGIV